MARVWSILCVEQCVASTVVSTDLSEFYFGMEMDARDAVIERLAAFCEKTNLFYTGSQSWTRADRVEWVVRDDVSQSTLSVFLRRHPHPESSCLQAASFYAQMWETIGPAQNRLL